MMIVVEGPDGAGKSTLVDQIVNNFGLPVAPRVVSKDTNSMIPSLKVWVEQNVARGFEATIYDRHRLISEPIYGSILRESFEPGFDDVQWLNSMYHMFYRYCSPLIIYCMPPYEFVRRNVQADEDNQPRRVRDSVRKIYAQYAAKAASDVPLAGALVYDYTSTPVPHILTTIEKAVERMHHV